MCSAPTITSITFVLTQTELPSGFTHRWEEERGIRASYFPTSEAHLPVIFYIQLKADSSVWQLHRTYLHFYSLTSKEGLKLKLKSEINSEILKWETYQQ